MNLKCELTFFCGYTPLVGPVIAWLISPLVDDVLQVLNNISYTYCMTDNAQEELCLLTIRGTFSALSQ